jgi:energy-converting hydrogenase Eha subunit B
MDSMDSRTSRTFCKMVCSLALLAGTAMPASGLLAQVDPSRIVVGEELYEIRLTDGSTLFARVTSVESESVTLITSGGTRVEVDPSQVAAMQPAEGQLRSGEFWRADPNVSRLFFTSTGRALERGRAYFGTYLIVLPFVAVGVTDWLTVAAGAPILLGQMEPFYIAPKLQIIRTQSAAISIGTLHFVLNEDFDDTDVGIAYGVGTFGSRDNAVTIGLGFGYAGSDFASRPVAMIGGELRGSRRVKLLTENYFLPGETGAVLSAGVRFIGERFSADLGIGGAAGDGDAACCLPLINVSYVFGGGL